MQSNSIIPLLAPVHPFGILRTAINVRLAGFVGWLNTINRCLNNL